MTGAFDCYCQEDGILFCGHQQKTKEIFSFPSPPSLFPLSYSQQQPSFNFYILHFTLHISHLKPLLHFNIVA